MRSDRVISDKHYGLIGGAVGAAVGRGVLVGGGFGQPPRDGSPGSFGQLSTLSGMVSPSESGIAVGGGGSVGAGQPLFGPATPGQPSTSSVNPSPSLSTGAGVLVGGTSVAWGTGVLDARGRAVGCGCCGCGRAVATTAFDVAVGSGVLLGSGVGLFSGVGAKVLVGALGSTMPIGWVPTGVP